MKSAPAKQLERIEHRDARHEQCERDQACETERPHRAYHSSMHRPAVAFVVTLALAACHREREPIVAVNPPEPVETSNPPGPSTPPVVASDWNGGWATNFGTLTIYQQGTHVTGGYVYDNGGAQVQGSIEGEVIGAQLDFGWSEGPGGAGAGHGVFTMNSDGKSFAGTWGQGESRTSGGNWDGTRN
jgi:hypothetical protein